MTYQPTTPAILLNNLGTPDAPTPKALRSYLREFLSDPDVVKLPRLVWLPILYGIILTVRPKRSAKLYQNIWTENGSPLLCYSEQLTKKLTEKTRKNFKLCMRYGNPSIKKALSELKAEGVEKIILLPLYPQYCEATTLSTIKAVKKQLKKLKYQPKLEVIEHYYNHPAYIDAMAKQIKAHRKHSHLVFSFHGIPAKNVEKGDPYAEHCHKTVALIADKLNLKLNEWDIVFQSRFGAAEWLQPYCEDVLKEYPKTGKTDVDVVCPGFSMDCLETIDEINREYRKIFLDAGGNAFNYIPALNDSELQCEMVEKIVRG